MYHDPISNSSQRERRSRDLREIAGAAVDEIGVQVVRSVISYIETITARIGRDVDGPGVRRRRTLTSGGERTGKRIDYVLGYPSSFIFSCVKKLRWPKIDF